MNDQPSALEAELAAYSPHELAEFASSVEILLKAADDGTVEYLAAQARIMTTLRTAIETRMESERAAGQTASVIPFPKR